MDIVSVSNNELDVQGSETFWFRFVYFTAGSTYAINGGRDIPIINYEAVRSARGFDRITLKGTIVAEIGHGRDDPFPGTISGIASNKATYFTGGTFNLDSADIQAITLINLAPANVIRLRRVTIFHPGLMDSPQLKVLQIRVSRDPFYSGGSDLPLGTSDNTNSPLPNLILKSGMVTVNDDENSDIPVGIVPQDSHSAPTPVAPIVLDWQLQSYLQPIVARHNDAISIGTQDGDIWPTHTALSLYIEFTQEPY